MSGEVVKFNARNDGITLFSNLDEAEEVLIDFQFQYVRVGQALLDIFDRELWREIPKCFDFEEYCDKRWDLQKSRAMQLVRAGKMAREIIAHRGDDMPLPSNEAQARALISAVKPNKFDPEDQVWARRAEGWSIVLDQAKNDEEEITAPYIVQVCERWLGGGSKVANPTGKKRMRDPVEEFNNAFDYICDSGFSVDEIAEKAAKKYPDGWEELVNAFAMLNELRQAMVRARAALADDAGQLSLDANKE